MIYIKQNILLTVCFVILELILISLSVYTKEIIDDKNQLYNITWKTNLKL